MEKNCSNCEKLKVCWVKKDNVGVISCGEWSGWHDAKEELPDDERIVLVIAETHDGNQHIGGGSISIKDKVAKVSFFDKAVLAENDIIRFWRELPEYEVEK